MKRGAGLLLIASLAVPVTVQAQQTGEAAAPQSPPPETSPIPEARPPGIVTKSESAEGVEPDTAAAPVDPDPETAADTDTDNVEADEMAAPGTNEAPPPGVWAELSESEEALTACLAALDDLGTVYTRGEPILDDDRDCGIANPILVQQLLPGVDVMPAATLRCDAVLAGALWMRDFVQPAAERLGRGPVTTVRNGSGYICRRRNNQPDGKLSEHSFGNALDVMGFEFAEGEGVAVQPREKDGTRAEAFQDAVRATACLEFATVLGPGADPYHDDHLHLDIKQRNGGYRLCQ